MKGLWFNGVFFCLYVGRWSHSCLWFIMPIWNLGRSADVNTFTLNSVEKYIQISFEYFITPSFPRKH